MMEDNIRYTAMRIFQDIEGADCIYINTYAATTPRLQAFKKICSNNSKEPELVENGRDALKKQKSTYNSDSAASEEEGSY
jgi:mRNA degradation ribonuclease J1/J2